MKQIVLDGYPFKTYRYKNGFYPKYRQIKLFLIKKYKVCYHCGKEVIDFVAKSGQQSPHNMATIDHLKQHPVRKKGEIVDKVLSCYGCNQDRSTNRENITSD